MSLVTENLKTYRVFVAMHHRCESPRSNSWPRYGGRGIRVAQEWSTFERFLADMGPQPEGMILDRIDNDGPYSASNCRWATRTESARNTSANRLVTAFGKTACIAEWSDATGINRFTLIQRLNRGWSPEAALTVSTGHKQNAAMAQLAPMLKQLAPLMKQAGLI